MSFVNSVRSHVKTIPSVTEHTGKAKLSTLITTISLLIGPLLFFVVNIFNGTYEASEKLLVFVAFLVTGFELTWIVYGVVSWVLGSFHISEEYSEFIGK